MALAAVTSLLIGVAVGVVAGDKAFGQRSRFAVAALGGAAANLARRVLGQADDEG